MKSFVLIGMMCLLPACSSAKDVGRGAASGVGRNVLVDESKAHRLPDGGLIGKTGDAVQNAQDKVLGTSSNEPAKPGDPIAGLGQMIGDSQRLATRSVETVLPGGVPEHAKEEDRIREEKRKKQKEELERKKKEQQEKNAKD